MYSTEPTNRYDVPDPQREAEETREDRWTAFVAWCHGDRKKSPSEWATMLYHVYQNMQGREDWHYAATNQALQQFAAEEGWSGVLSAIARAMKEDETAAREAQTDGAA